MKSHGSLGVTWFHYWGKNSRFFVMKRMNRDGRHRDCGHCKGHSFLESRYLSYRAENNGNARALSCLLRWRFPRSHKVCTCLSSRRVWEIVRVFDALETISPFFIYFILSKLYRRPFACQFFMLSFCRSCYRHFSVGTFRNRAKQDEIANTSYIYYWQTVYFKAFIILDD